MTKSSNRSFCERSEAKTRFISPLGEIFIDAVNKGLQSNQTAVSTSRKAKIKSILSIIIINKNFI